MACVRQEAIPARSFSSAEVPELASPSWDDGMQGSTAEVVTNGNSIKA